MEIIPEFNTTCFLTINDRVRDAVTAYPLYRTGDAELILTRFVRVIVGGGTVVTRPHSYEIFDLRERYVGRAWGWKRTEV